MLRYPISRGVEIRWRKSTELAPVNIKSLSEAEQVRETYEYFPATDRWITHEVRSTIERKGAKFFVTLEYDATTEAMLDADYRRHGRTIISIDTNTLLVSAQWVGQFDTEAEGSSPGKIIITKIMGPHRRAEAEPPARSYTLLRDILISLDGRCAISGETTPAVLDAVCLIAQSAGGNEVIENAILMRADLSRLYAQGHFHISADGALVASDGLGGAYAELLDGAVLSEDVLARVDEALQIAGAMLAGRA
jgi:hypothetical protein